MGRARIGKSLTGHPAFPSARITGTGVLGHLQGYPLRKRGKEKNREIKFTVISLTTDT